MNRDAIEARVQQRLTDWRGLLTESISDGRQLLREVLEGPLRFTPEGKTYRFAGVVATGRLIASVVQADVAKGHACVASPTGNRIIDLPKFLGSWRSDRKAAA